MFDLQMVILRKQTKLQKTLKLISVALILADVFTGTFHQNKKRWMNSSLSYLNHKVHLSVRVVLRGLSSLAGWVHCVTPAAAPRHGHVTVVREARDPLAARSETNMKTWGQRENLCQWEDHHELPIKCKYLCFLHLILIITSIVVDTVFVLLYFTLFTIFF